MDTRIIIIEYALPHLDNIPNIVEYKFIQARNETNTKTIKKTNFKNFIMIFSIR